ncbi:MAG: META domain-containing protein [Flavobacteriales bacterium]|nr:META domain-containing protein [Flavobacteriales bacterium]MCB0794848.1 META domain-containing protein [Flavobacteriales bacterium]
MTRSLTLLVLVLPLMAQKCSDDQGRELDVANMLDKKWVFESINGQAISLPDGMEAPWLQFAKEGAQVSGNNGCNSLFGSYGLEGNALSFSGMGTTKMYCEQTAELEQQVMGVISNTDAVDLKDGALQLLQNGSSLASLRTSE